MFGIFLDIETTGLDSTVHRTIDLAFIILNLHTGKERVRYETLVSQPCEVWEKRDSNSSNIHRITYEELKNGQAEEEVKKQIIKTFHSLKIQRSNAVYICQNPSFDRSFFSQIIPVYSQEEYLWPYHWLDLASFFWALKKELFIHKENPFSFLCKDKIAQELGLSTEAQPHRAMNGVEHLLACYQKLF